MRRSYALALLASAALGAAYVGYGQLQAWGDRVTARETARDAAADLAEAQRFDSHADALLKRVRALPAFNAPTPCNASGPQICFTTPARPRVALTQLSPVLAQIGIALAPTCDDGTDIPTKLRVAMGTDWLPCSASTRVGELGVAVTAYPTSGGVKSGSGHLVFNGTRIRLELVP